MGWMMDQYSTSSAASRPAVITGKPLALGGSQGRDTATADGACHVIQTLRDAVLPGIAAPTVAVQGFGNAGQTIAALLHEAGYRSWRSATRRARIARPRAPRPDVAGQARSGELEGVDSRARLRVVEIERDHQRGAARTSTSTC